MTPPEPSSSEAEWNRMERTLKKLYIKDRLPLKGIATILERDHDFHAASVSSSGLRYHSCANSVRPHMYKHPMKKWKLRKNYNLKELEAVANTARCFIRAGVPLPKATFNHLVPVQRAKRCFRTLFKADSNQTAAISRAHQERKIKLKSTRESAQRSSQHFHNQYTVMSMATLHHSDDPRDLEYILIQVNGYFTWLLDKDAALSSQPVEHWHIPPEIRNSKFFAEIFDYCFRIAKGATHLASNLINKVRTEAVQILQCDDVTLLPLLLYYCCNFMFAGVVHMLGSTFAYIGFDSRRVLGQAHPMTLILELANRSGGYIASCDLGLQFMYDVAVGLHGGHSKITDMIESLLVHTFIYEADLYTASVFCKRALQRHLKTSGHNTFRFRSLLAEFGLLHWVYGFDEEAETIFYKGLDLHESAGDIDDQRLWIKS